MKYYKIVEEGYITAIGTDCGGVEITEEQYNAILEIVHNKPAATETTDFRLRDNLTWEEYEVPPQPDPDIDDAEAYDIIFGGGGE